MRLLPVSVVGPVLIGLATYLPGCAPSSSEFDGQWAGTMDCSDCEHCPGPLTKDVFIEVKGGRFEFIPDAYSGEGSIDDKGNIEIHYVQKIFWAREAQQLQFDGSFDGTGFRLEGIRGPRQCEMYLTKEG